MRIILLWPIALAVLGGCATVAPLAAPDSKNRVVDVVNTTNDPAQFYAVNATQRAWQAVRFAEAEIPANSYLTINFVDHSGACLFDLYAALPLGRKIEQRRFDTCAEVSWVIQPETGQ